MLSEGSSNTTRVFTVNVNRAYPLKSAHHGKMKETPVMASIIILHTNPSCCTPCVQLTSSETYIVAGYYRDHPNLQWYMPADDSLAAPYSNSEYASKYIKKMGRWIAAANIHREQANGTSK